MIVSDNYRAHYTAPVYSGMAGMSPRVKAHQCAATRCTTVVHSHYPVNNMKAQWWQFCDEHYNANPRMVIS